MAFIPPPRRSRRILSLPGPERAILAAAIVIILVILAVTLAGGAKGPDLEIVSSPESFAGLNEGITFPRELRVSLDGEAWKLRALGSGTRRQLMFSVYEAAAWTEAGRELGVDPARAMIEGDFVSHLRLRFLRDVTGDKVREAFATGFGRVLPPKPPSTLVKARDELLGYFEAGVGGGETVELTRVPGRGLFVRVGGDARPPIADPELARTVWAIYFGERPVSEDLKQELLRLAGGD